MKTNRGGQSSGRHVVRAAKGRQEVVQRLFVQQVDDRYANTPFIFVAPEKIVISKGHIEEVP